ncbi:phosphoribosylamine--glycine ligase [Ornithinibacillus gellani]|uniref:phosphoribosylamine--glycine ligase n=1 Tax=Ornithinibacillus gellani TaxID=2293253 RepID=UPI000F46A372|nr:phosphoribosylamine--glycine ligase [Ornithinibacillus gellani]TQS71898.1 phosphoribosylamine--glycine ligase [Ornithinibacillus gellani]
MNVLVIGRGGREHSMIKKLLASDRINKLFVAPGNGGMADEAVCLDIDEIDIDQLIAAAREHHVDLTIVGPEVPLLAGITNRFQAEGLAIFAPTKEAAMLEGSKDFAKAFMMRHGIPTAAYETFTDAAAAKAYIEEKGAPIVIKADGLAAGKGVVVAETVQDAIAAVDAMLVDQVFAEAGTTIVVEEFLAGKEFSLMAFVHENQVYPMVTARDHKRAFDQDQGPNTGGMGAFAPVADVSEKDLQFAIQEILQRAADGLVAEDRPFTGILYAGLIMTTEGLKVIEFNTRFGDPETQVVLPLLKNDLLQVFEDVLAGKDPELTWEDACCAGVVVAANGYPGTYAKALPIPNFTLADDSFLIYAGAKQTAEGLVSDGGRVLLAGATAKTLDAATEKAYQSLGCLSAEDGFFYRKDIGK